jgi:serine/threonine-protein kinase
VGAGTLGPVFRSHDPIEGRLVAIKAFRLDLSPRQATDFTAALDDLRTRVLDHPSIASPIAAGVEGTTPWLAQTYIPAESLDTALRQYGPPPIADALTMITHLAGAIDYAAAAGVLHGALHPRDVLVAPEETHLIDLGVAPALEAVGVRAPVRRPYTAPERLNGAPITRATDVFALGALAYEVLTGSGVSGAGDDAVNAMPEVPGADREALIETFAFALATAPDERFASALAFVASLKRALGQAATSRAPRGLPAVPTAPTPTGMTRATEPAPIGEHEPEARPSPQVAADSPRRETWSEFLDAPLPSEPKRPLTGTLRLTRPAASTPELESDESAPEYAGEHVPVTTGGGAFASSDRGDEGPPRLDSDALATFASETGGPADTLAYQSPADVAFAGAVGPRRSWAAFAAMLLIGIVLGFAAGYAWMSRGSSTASTPTSSAAVAPDRPAQRSSTQPRVEQPAAREFTERVVPPPPASSKRPPQTAPSAARPAPPPASVTPAAEATRREPPVVRGRLVIRSTPSGARVQLNGRDRGTTPVTLRDLPLTSITVRVSRAGYEPREERVSLTRARSTDTLAVTLRPTATSGRTTTPPRTQPQPSAGVADRADPSERFLGSVLFDSRPVGARVYLDGNFLGVTPLQTPEVRAGSHAVRFEKDGFRRWTASVQVVAGERTRVAASLEEAVQ